MTYADEQQMIAYERAALNCILNRANKLAARKGVPAARDLLETLRKPTAGRTARERTVHPSCPREES